MFAHVRIPAWILVLVVLALALALVRPSRGAGVETRYVVRAGDTLWTIAADRYAGDPRKGVWLIAQRNELNGAPLQPGTVLFLPS
jgi:nucleoid-associated protein YgaU